MIFDLHTHTTLSSCSVLGIDHMLGIAEKIGLDGLCVTDHQTMGIRDAISEGLQPNGVTVIFGMEYATSEGDFLIFGPYEEIPAGLDAKRLLHHVSETRGAAVAAHPFRADRPVARHLIRHGACTAIECINGRNSEIENLDALRWGHHRGLAGTGGSDAHTPAEIGNAITRFSMDVRSRADLIHALRTRRCRPERHFQTAA